MAQTTARKRDLIGVVTVNWNGWRHTRACLASLRRSKGAAWRLYIVDNASDDGSADHLRDLGPDTVLIASDVNGGWTGGNNLGVERALADDCEYLFLLNNDAKVEPRTLAELLAYCGAHADEAPVVGPIELDEDGRRVAFKGASEDPATGLPAWGRPDLARLADVTDVAETVFIKGSGIFAHRKVFERVGPFDDRFFLNFDDTDWSYRARAAGHPLRMVKAARIRHVGSAAIGGATSPLQAYFLARNGLLFAEKHLRRDKALGVLRSYVWALRDLPRRRSRRWWMWSFLTERDGAYPAFRRGVADYLLRRFGDCPQSVRDASARHAARRRERENVETETVTVGP